MNKKLSTNFESWEFDSPDSIGSGVNISPILIYRLQNLRTAYKKPIYINSGVRTPARNKLVGGLSDSSHLIFLAVDIEVLTSADRFLLISLALQVGFNRIGIGRKMLHFDIDADKPQNMIWTYYPKISE